MTEGNAEVGPLGRRSAGALRLGALFWIGVIVLTLVGLHLYRKHSLHGGMDGRRRAEAQQLADQQSADHKLAPLAAGVVPEWKILVLVYPATQVDYIDKTGQEHRLRAQMTPEELGRIAPAMQRFVEQDLPQLASGHVRATAKIKVVPYPLVKLGDGCGLYPDPKSTIADQEPGFDSIIVFWDASGVNAATGRIDNPHQCGGLTPDVGVDTTYTTITIDRLPRNERNVIKHEWGHSILFYFAALGRMPKPIVTNHIDRTNNVYVNCPSGRYYDLSDETDDRPLPNSIYHNSQGFTHDYYSGTVALPSDPSRCLGIPASAWRYSPTAVKASNYR